MSNQRSPLTTQGLTIQLEVVAEDEQQDIADTDEIGRSFFEHLRENGYTVTPAHTGRKGGEPFLDILLQIPQFLHDNKDLLVAMFESVTLVLQCLFIARDKRAEREKAKRAPLRFTLLVDGKPLTIEAADVKDAAKLVAQFQKLYPDEAKKVTMQSKMKIKAHASKKKRRGSH
jgi:hypothetical protein